MFYTRRRIQKVIDEVRVSFDAHWVDSAVNRLNNKRSDPFAAFYELTLVHGLSRFGDLSVEKLQPNGKKPDIEFANSEISFVADITCVSDAGIRSENPEKQLEELIEKLKDELGLPIGGIDLRYDVQTETKRRNLGRFRTEEVAKSKLAMPGPSKIRAYFKNQIEPEIRRQFKTGSFPIVVEASDDEASFRLVIDPDKSPYISSGHTVYNRPTNPDRNPYFKALKAKARKGQLKGLDVPTGIIVCDGDCATMRQSSGSSNDLLKKLTADFLRMNTSIDFVLAVTVFDHQHTGWFAMPSEFELDFSLAFQPRFELAAEFRALFRDLLHMLPKPNCTATNARHRIEGRGYPLGFHGGHLTRGPVRISSRHFLEILSGERDASSLAINGEVNPFSHMLDDGRLPVAFSVLPGGVDKSDDWIEVDFGPPDPSISQFR